MNDSDRPITSQTEARIERARWLALVGLCAGMLMIILDQTIVNVALPSIQRDLHFTQANLAWVVNAYLIAFGGLLLLAGRVGDLVGRKRVFMIGLTVFTVASVVCGLSDSQGMLIGARFIQGIGGALTSSVILGMIVTMFPGGEERGRAIGIYSFVAAAGASLGLLLGGVLTQAINWHWIFFVNVPIAVLTATLVVRLLERDEGLGLRHGADVPGAVLVTGALMLGVYAVVEASRYHWGSAHTLGVGGVALALLVAFLARQAYARQPLMPLRILRAPNVAAANLIQVLMVAGLLGMFFLGALYMQQVLHYDAVEVGLAFLPVALSIAVFSVRFSAVLTARFGPRSALTGALLLIAVGLGLFSRVPVDANYVTSLLPVMLLLGVGAGIAFPALMTLAMSGATPQDSGLASGLVNTTQQVGGAIGLALLASLSTTRTNHLLGLGDATSVARVGGYHLAFAIAAGLVVVGIVVAATGLRPVAVVEPAVEAEPPEVWQAEAA